MSHGFSLTVVLSCTLLVAACGKESSAPPSGEKSLAPKGGAAAPVDVAAVRTQIQGALAEAKEHVAAKHWDKLHEPAGRIWGLAAKLRAAKAPYGQLFQLARDLDTQGDAGNANGVMEVMAKLEKEVAKPSSPDAPDDGAPLEEDEHEKK